MTNRNTDMPDLFVVDGSNIATEGRDKPSLEQLNEAVDAFRSEYPDLKLTVVVDATFGHRILKKEVKAFDKAVASNEIVTPPAGAVGRGDAFILAIADKAGAGVLSNDSFQEFHGEYGWLFEHGRLIGGKPVPHVGWVFVDRNPVRGPKSRESIKAAQRAEQGSPTDAKDQARRRVRKKKAAAAEPETPVEDVATDESTTPADAPAADAPSSTAGRSRSRRRGGRGRSKAAAENTAADTGQSSPDEPSSGAPASTNFVNDLLAFLEFVERHPVGAEVSGKVDSYSSHGAYAKVGDVQVYIPLRLMSSPPPTSARKVLTIGDDVELVIIGFLPDRRSIDAALPAMAGEALPDGSEPGGEATPTEAAPEPKARARRRTSKKAAAAPPDETTSDDTTPTPEPAAKKTAARRTAAKKPAAKRTAAKKPAAKKRAAKKRAAKTAAATTSAAKKTSARRPAAKTAAAKKKAAAKQPAAKKPAAKKPAAKTPAAKKPAAKKTATKRKAPAKRRAPAKRAATDTSTRTAET